MALVFWLIPGLPLLWALGFIWPAARPWLRRGALLPVLPALLAPMVFPEGGSAHSAALLFGVDWRLSGDRSVLLGVTALVWLTAAWFARGYMARDPRRHRFEFFFHLTMAGNLGLPVAGDPVSFYTLFALMSLASYGLIIHNDTTEALRAGRVYIILALVGEVALFVGLVGRVAEVDALWPWLWLGLAIKAGVVPLHVWLPLAHPAAPVPASAVLSGAMIKAGVLGWLLFPPPAEMAGFWGMVMVVLGVFGAFYAAVLGVMQSRAKEVLAYSSVSQMGVITAAVGAAWVHPVAASALLAAVVVYVVHHALAKGALFLLVGWLERGGRVLIWLILVLTALVMAGLPVTSGAAAKQVLKEALVVLPADAGWVGGLLALSGLVTTVLMGRLLVVAREMVRPIGTEQHRPELPLGAGLAVLLMVLAPLVWPPLGAGAVPTVGKGLVDALWPLLGGVAVAGFLARRWGAGPWGKAVPTGDWIHLLRRCPVVLPLKAGLTWLTAGRVPTGSRLLFHEWVVGRLARRSLALETGLMRLLSAGIAMAVLAGMVAVALLL